MDPRQLQHIVVNDNDVHSIVMSYLLHNCFDETAETLASTAGIKQPEIDPDYMERRKQIMHFVLEKMPLEAIELTEQLAQGLLEENEDAHFDLISLHLLELICAAKGPEALEFGRTRLAPFGKVPKYVKMERLLPQVIVARRYLSEENGEDAFPPFSLKDCLKGETSHDRLQRLLGE